MLGDILSDVPMPALVAGGVVLTVVLFPYINAFHYNRKVKAAGGVHAPKVQGRPFGGKILVFFNWYPSLLQLY